MKSWCVFSLFLAYLQEYEKPQGIHALWTWPAHGIPPLSPCKSSEPKLFSDVPKESFHQIAEITNNGFIDETCGQTPVQQQGRIPWHYFLVRFFRFFFFLNMKSGFPMAHMNEWTVQPFATAKILLILLVRWKDEEDVDQLCICYCRQMSPLSPKSIPRCKAWTDLLFLSLGQSSAGSQQLDLNLMTTWGRQAVF